MKESTNNSQWFEMVLANRSSDHYELLGLLRFEEDIDRIDRVAQDRAELLQELSGDSKYLEVSQKLLNQIAKAKLVLMDQQKKVVYDQRLRNRGASSERENEIPSGQKGKLSAQQQAKARNQGKPTQARKWNASPIVILAVALTFLVGICGYALWPNGNQELDLPRVVDGGTAAPKNDALPSKPATERKPASQSRSTVPKSRKPLVESIVKEPLKDNTPNSGLAVEVNVFVNSQDHSNRIQLLNDGRYFATDCDENGTYKKKGNIYTLVSNESLEKKYSDKGGVLVDDKGIQWVKRDSLLKFPWKDATPVEIVVTDRLSKHALTEFGYTYTISTPNAYFDPLLVQPIDVKSKNGTFTLMAPESCEIFIEILSPAILQGFNESNAESHALMRENLKRKLHVQIDIGSVIQGKVIDQETKHPIQGAIVSPCVFTPPLFSADRSRQVTTDSNGEFRLLGVDPNSGVNVWHADYFETRMKFEKEFGKNPQKTYPAEIELESGATLMGAVNDSDGRPIAGVKVDDGAGKKVFTNRDGRFTLRSPQKWNSDYQFSLNKGGFLEYDLHINDIESGEVKIQLQPEPTLQGFVVDANGQRITNYEVWVGTGKDPRPWRCQSQQVTDSDAQFKLGVRTDWDYDEEGKVWVGIKAPGHAVWESTFDVWKGAQSITASLESGVTIKGSVGKQSSTSRIQAFLLPHRTHNGERELDHEASKRQKLGQKKTSLTQEGTFQFQHIPKGQYFLAISGPEITPQSRTIEVSDTDLDVEEFNALGRGSILGTFKDPDDKSSAFANGEIFFKDNQGISNADYFPHLAEIKFKTDQNGEFQVNNVPTGRVRVRFPFHATADIIDAHVREALVVPGKATRVNFFNESAGWDVRCKFVIGNGSREQFLSGTGFGANRKVANVNNGRGPVFRIELEPPKNVPNSFADADWMGLDENSQIILKDVQPGAYRISVSDWLMSRGFLGTIYESDIQVDSNQNKVKIALGGGCITGNIQWTKSYRHRVHILGMGEKHKLLRHARCDQDGDFCLRYLNNDRYTLYAHDYQAGWCKLTERSVAGSISDIGTFHLAQGGTITGPLPLNLRFDKTVNIVATHESGISIEDPDNNEGHGDTFQIANLWPGKWTVAIKKGDVAVKKRVVQLEGTKTVACIFASD